MQPPTDVPLAWQGRVRLPDQRGMGLFYVFLALSDREAGPAANDTKLNAEAAVTLPAGGGVAGSV